MIDVVVAWLEANQGWTTTVANVVTIGGVLAIFNVVRSISISLALSASVSAHLLTAKLETTAISGGAIDTTLPPGDQSRVHYEAYRASKRWDDPYYSGNFAANTLRTFTREQWRRYDRHMGESFQLLDCVLRSSPTRDAQAAWKTHMASDVLDHGRALRRVRWRVASFIYSKPMQELMKLARRRAS